MFILLKSGAMLNLFWLQDCFVGKHDKNIVIFYMINGSKVIEEYDTEQEAKDRVDEVHSAMDNVGIGSSAGSDSGTSTGNTYSRNDIDRFISNINSNISNLSNKENTDISNLTNALNLTDTNVSNLDNRVTNLETSVSNITNDVGTMNNNILNITNTVEDLNNTCTNNFSNMTNNLTNISNILEWNEY